MARPEDCLFTKTHEWVHREGNEVLVGISTFAQQELGDIVYVNLGEPGRNLKAGEQLGEIESVKAVAEVYAPVSGIVGAVNGALTDSPEKVNKDPHGEGWLVRIRLATPAELDGMMDFAAYSKYMAEEGH
ncbi:MAG: glycine cleavage system protein GcvH [Acidobacteria bacterium]|jgi:glycine cleavage system H protein|nr:glycine cleavage system protein GcvH [Acidobacteriota bacterium]MCU0253281.1 glycine cleavage system protein GcvH [Acidobacteriota bacterium]